MNYSVETAYGKVIVKTEEDIESDRCRLYVREQHLFAFAKDGKRMEVDPWENDRKLPFGLKTVATVCGDTGCGPVGWRNLGVGREGFLVTR